MLLKAVRRIALVILLTLTSFAMAGAAQAAPAHAKKGRLSSPPVLDIHVTPEGFTVPGPNPRPSGPVTFRVTAEGPTGYYWSAYKLLNGTTLVQFVEWMQQSNSPDPDVALPALRLLYQNVDYSGGAVIHPGKTIELTQTLTPGVYYFGSSPIGGWQPTGAAAPSISDLAASGPSISALQSSEPSPFGWLEITEEVQRALPLPINGVVSMHRVGDRNFIAATTVMRANGRILVRNRTSQPQEAVFVELRPGATDRDIQEYFDAQREGRPLPPRPFFGNLGGMLALAPGKELLLSVDLPPGRYGVFSWLRDAETGIDSAALGMHRVVTLR